MHQVIADDMSVSIKIVSSNTFILAECQSCYFVPPPVGRRTGTRGLTRGTSQASATRQRQPIWMESNGCHFETCKQSLLGLLSPVCCSRSENKVAVGGVKVCIGVTDEGAPASQSQCVRIVPDFFRHQTTNHPTFESFDWCFL